MPANMSKLQYSTETVSPKKAAEWLKLNVNNRPLAEATIKAYVGALERGEWQLNGEAIKFDSNGHLMNGQHRLHACVRSGVAFTTTVIRGVSPDVAGTQDIPRKRSKADEWKIRGEEHYALLQPAARIWFAYTHMKIRGRITATYPQLDVILDQHPILREAVMEVKALAKTRMLSPGPAAFLYGLFAERDAKRAKEFFERLTDGTQLAKSSPIYMLRERLISERGSKGAYKAMELMALTIKAWVAFITNKQIKVLRWKRVEAFPYLDTKGTGFVPEPDHKVNEDE